MLDGVNVNNNFQSDDGVFSMITPRLDAVEEVTVTGAVPSADQGALGAVQVSFVTRSGTNNFDGSIYHYFRSPDLNSNYYFNKIRGLERNDVVVHQYGGRVGGPIVIPGLFDGRNKAFFFFNMEEFYQPTEASRTRTILHPRAQEGWFRYNVDAGRRHRGPGDNLFARAAGSRRRRSDDACGAGEHPRGRGDDGHDQRSHEPDRAAFLPEQRQGQQHAPTGPRGREPDEQPSADRLITGAA